MYAYERRVVYSPRPFAPRSASRDVYATAFATLSAVPSPCKGREYGNHMNPLQRLARNPTAYRWVVLPGRPVAEGLESLLRFLSTGRLGVLDVVGLPCVQITTSGGKTGLARTATVQYVPVDDGLLVVGSNWGREGHPAWSANLKAAERVTVRRRGRRFVAKVRLLCGEERDQAWATVLSHWPNYQIAQDRAGRRQFRLFLLTPTA